MIDTTFNMYTDANGGDPDATSPTLRRYHKLLWSKPLPGGAIFDLREAKGGYYLRHSSDLGDFSLGSDAITHSYKTHSNKKSITEEVPQQVQELFDLGSTIGGYIVFPNNQINRKFTLNQARGISRLIDDRFDLTLECIRRFYLRQENPLDEVILRYASFFELFGSFDGYVQFFLLNDLMDGDGNVKFYLPFDDFQSPPKFRDKVDYLTYKRRVKAFIRSRNQRIEDFAKQLAGW